jgi:hypothetical protein
MLYIHGINIYGNKNQTKLVMENQCQETPTLLQDLKVTIQNSSLVFPNQETERKSIFLSNYKNSKGYLVWWSWSVYSKQGFED